MKQPTDAAICSQFYFWRDVLDLGKYSMKQPTDAAICSQFYFWRGVLDLGKYSMKQPTDAAICSQFYSTARFTLHVSGVLHTHHQEYNL